MGVSCLNSREQNRHGHYRVCILHRPSEKPQSGSKITLFELSKEMVPGTFTIGRREPLGKRTGRGKVETDRG